VKDLFVRVRYRRAGEARADKAGRLQTGRAWAKRALYYFEHRPDEEGEKGHRLGYDAQSKGLSEGEMAKRLEATGDEAYLYTLILNPGDEHGNMGARNRREWVRETMSYLETQQAHKGHRLEDWIAVDHTDKGNHDHVHVLAVLSHTLQKSDLAGLREAARVSYESHRDLPRTLEQDLKRDPLEGMTLHKARVLEHPRTMEEKVLEGELALSLGLYPERRGRQLKLILEVGVKESQLLPTSSGSVGQRQLAQPDSSEKIKAHKLELDL